MNKKMIPEADNCTYGDGFPIEGNNSQFEKSNIRDAKKSLTNEKKKITTKNYNSTVSADSNVAGKNSFKKK